MLLGALMTLGISGCGADSGNGSEIPEGSIPVVENQPQSLGEGLEAVASDITEDGAYLALFAEDREELSGWTVVGESVLLDGHEITLVSTGVDLDEDSAPGSSGSTAYLVVEDE